MITTRRYVYTKTFLQILLFSIEFLFLFGKLISYNFSEEFFFVFGGYILMVCFFVGRNHNGKVYLRYETGLSLIMKTITVNVIVVFFISALSHFEMVTVCKTMAIFTLLNIVTIIVINMFGNVILKIQMKDRGEMLYIYGESERYKVNAVSDNGIWIHASEPLSEIEKKIDLCDAVYLVDISSENRNELIKICYEKEKIVFITTKLSDILIKASGITQDGDTPVYYCECFGIGKGSAITKRAFDLVCSVMALIVLSPLFLIVTLLIKLEDGGPVIYQQTRCTQGQKEFQIYKFRSMREDSETDGAQLSKADDDRVTRIGKFIRYTKIDELPQLFNIIKGDMSIVGPRPERPELIEETIKEVPEFALRMKVKAGLTGYAQVRGYYNTAFLDKLKWDLIYIENYSFLLDIKIIIMTVFVIFQNNMRGEKEEHD